MTLEEKIRQAMAEGDDPEDKTKEPENKTTGTTTDSSGRVRITTADGEEIEGESYEAIARTLAAREREKAGQEPKTVAEAWDDKTFASKFVNNPKEGLEYYEEKTYGFKLRDALPVLLAELRDLRAAREDTEYDRFFSANKDYVKNYKNGSIIAEVLKRKNLPVTAENMEMAWEFGKKRGLVEVGKGVDKTDEPQEPARMPRGPRTTPTARDEGGALDLSRLSDEKLEELVSGGRDDLAAFFRGSR